MMRMLQLSARLLGSCGHCHCHRHCFVSGYVVSMIAGVVERNIEVLSSSFLGLAVRLLELTPNVLLPVNVVDRRGDGKPKRTFSIKELEATMCSKLAWI